MGSCHVSEDRMSTVKGTCNIIHIKHAWDRDDHGLHMNGTHVHHEIFVWWMINKYAGAAQAAFRVLNCP